jgi:four helix bundle protein
MELARHTYSVTATFLKEELYGLTQQARRCSVSIPSNIAEGAARRSTKEAETHHPSPITPSS